MDIIQQTINQAQEIASKLGFSDLDSCLEYLEKVDKEVDKNAGKTVLQENSV